MTPQQWSHFKQAAKGLHPECIPLALIVDSPWLPGFLGIHHLDYFLDPEIWQLDGPLYYQHHRDTGARVDEALFAHVREIGRLAHAAGLYDVDLHAGNFVVVREASGELVRSSSTSTSSLSLCMRRTPPCGLHSSSASSTSAGEICASSSDFTTFDVSRRRSGSSASRATRDWREIHDGR